MDLFEFIAGMLGVILALVVAQLFLGLANLVQTRAPLDDLRAVLEQAGEAIRAVMADPTRWPPTDELYRPTSG